MHTKNCKTIKTGSYNYFRVKTPIYHIEKLQHFGVCLYNFDFFNFLDN